MIIKVLLIAIVFIGAIDCQNFRYKRQGAKGQRVQQEQEYEPQEPVRRPSGSAIGAPARQRPPRVQEEEKQINAEGEANPEPPIYGGVMGTPGVDFPAYGQIPKTSFKCTDVPYEPGMYADEETQCQAYHVCFQGRKESFLCGIGTVFNQAILGCDYWHSVDCASSSKFYSVNEELGKAGSEPGPQQAARPAVQRPAPQQRPAPAIQRPSQAQDDQQEGYEEAPQRIAPAPRPIPSKTRQPPAPIAQRPAPAPRPSKTAPAPRPRPVVAPRPAALPQRPSKTRIAPAVRTPAPIVQSQEQDQQGDYEGY